MLRDEVLHVCLLVWLGLHFPGGLVVVDVIVVVPVVPVTVVVLIHVMFMVKGVVNLSCHDHIN